MLRDKQNKTNNKKRNCEIENCNLKKEIYIKLRPGIKKKKEIIKIGLTRWNEYSNIEKIFVIRCILIETFR